MEEEPRRKTQEGDMAEDESGMRTYVGDVLEADVRWKTHNAGGIWEAAGTNL